MSRFLTLSEFDRATLTAGVRRVLRRSVERSLPYASVDDREPRLIVMQSMRIWVASVRDLREAAQDGRDLRHIARATTHDHHQLGSDGNAATMFATSTAAVGSERAVSSVAQGDLARGFERALALSQSLDLADWEVRRLRVPELRTEILWARGPGEMPDFTCVVSTMLSLRLELHRMHASAQLIAVLATARSIDNWPRRTGTGGLDSVEGPQ
jgi:hypothetical protein